MLKDDMTDEDWKAWAELTNEIAEIIASEQLTTHVAFHGTSTHALHAPEGLRRVGMRPTRVAHAYFDRKTLDLHGGNGSFWGQLKTAAWYAESDVLDIYQSGRPVLIAAATDVLACKYPLHPDRATLDAPVDATLREALRGRADDWYKHHSTLGWEQALREIGAIFAVHEEPIPFEEMAVITSTTDFEAFRLLRFPGGTPPRLG